MKIKISDILLKENESLYRLLESQIISEMKNLSEYEPTRINDQTKIIDRLLNYCGAANNTIDMFGDLIESERIGSETLTIPERILVFEIFEKLYPEEYEKLTQAVAQEDLNLGEKRIQVDFDDFCQKYFEKIDSYKEIGPFQKKLMLATFGMRLIQSIDDGMKTIKENIKKYLFEKVLDKYVPESSLDFKTIKTEYIKTMAEDSNVELKKIVDGSNLSGWVIYIFGRNVDDSSDVIDELEPVAKKYNMPFFITTNKYYSSGTITPKNCSAILYLPYDVVKQGIQKSVLDDIVNSLSTYKPLGVVPDTKKYGDNVYYSYILNTSFDNLPDGGISYDELENYKKSDGTIFQPDLLKRVNGYYAYIIENIKTLENFKDFIYSEIKQKTKKINWVEMGYKSNDGETNVNDFITKIFRAKEKDIYLRIPKKGFESYGINNLRDFVKNLN